MNQRKYVLDLLCDTGMMGCHLASTPMDPNTKISSELRELLSNPASYQRLICCLIYLTNTRPDIAFAVSIVIQFMHAPRISHMEVVNYILRDLKTCPGLGLCFASRIQYGVSCFTDADYAGSKSDSVQLQVFALSMVNILSLGKVKSK